MTLRDNYATILRLGAPILVGQLGMIVVGFADNIMLGRYSTSALASASLVNNLFNTAIFACVGFSYGLTPLLGALFSRGEQAKIGRMLRNGVFINVLYALLVTLVMGAIYLNLDRMGQPRELMPQIRPYYLIYLSGMVAIALFNVFAQWAYSINRTQMPMWIILGANAINVLGNYVLIYGHWGAPELGIVGAGLSTLVARWICPIAIIAIFFSLKRFRGYSLGFRGGRQRLRYWGVINRTSWPVSLQMVFESGSFTAAAVMAGWLGAYELASFQIIVIVGSLGFCVYYSLGTAVSVRVANAAGLGDIRGMRSVAWAGYHIMLTLAAMASLAFVFAGELMVRAFTEDPIVIAMTVSLIVPLVLYQLGDATQITFANALRGTSRVTPMMWIAAISYVVIGVPATYLLGIVLGMGIYGIVLSFSVSLFCAAGMFLYYFIRTTKLS